MPYTTSYIKENNIVCITAHGSLTAEEYQKGSIEVVDMLLLHDSKRLFVDDRELENAATLIDFYELPNFFREIGLPPSVRVAILYDSAGADKNDLEFFVTVCRNNGYNVKMFYSYDSAMECLTS